MSDIKMSDLLALPVARTSGGVMPFLKDGNGEVMFVGDGFHIDAVVHAVNTHDTMQARIVELESLIKEADDYLNTNKLTTICNGSILHAAFKEAIKDEKGS